MKVVEHLFALIDGTDVSVSNMQALIVVRKHAVNVVKLGEDDDDATPPGPSV
jgi:hypothetical protein